MTSAVESVPTMRSGVLLVEDNADDELLTCHEFRRQGLLNDITVARDGAQALDYIFGRGAYEGRDVMEQPIVVLLDLNLPKLSGIDVLKAIRSDPRTVNLPVVIMTSSEEDIDISDGYENGANSYIVKPVKFDDFSGRIRELGMYWILANQIPGKTPPRPPDSRYANAHTSATVRPHMVP